MTESDDRLPPSLIRPDGSRFGGELEVIGAALAQLDNASRETYRDRNADDIARHAAQRLLIVGGPGSGKTQLFLARIKTWLPQDSGACIYVATFVRKLVKDLRAEIDNETELLEEDQARISVTTLHTLARSLISSNQGTAAQRLERDVQIISADWKDVVWADVLGFHPDLDARSYTHRRLERQFYTEEPDESESWQALRATYFHLGRFYNAVGFPDMISLACQAIEENPSLNVHSHWIIDEFQDLNRSEVHLIDEITRTASGVVIAGDDEQALYEELKASLPEFIISFYDDPKFANAMLPFCSRCSYYICVAAADFIARRRMSTAIPKIFLPLQIDPTAQKVRVIGTAAPTTAVDYIADFINEHQTELEAHRVKMEAGEETDPYLLILTPVKNLRFYDPGGAADRLRQLVYEWSTVRAGPGPDYQRTAEYASMGWREANNFALRKVLHYEGLSSRTVHDFLEAAIARGVRLTDVLDSDYDALRNKAKAVAAICADRDHRPDEKATALGGLLAISDAQRLARDLQAHPLDLFWAIAGDEAEETIENASAMAPVELVSFAGAKGLSAHHVILIGCDDLHLAKVSSLTFFVALTRARRSLHVITSLKAGGSKGTHQYVLDLSEACCEYFTKTKRAMNRLPNAVAFVRELDRWSYGASQVNRQRQAVADAKRPEAP